MVDYHRCISRLNKRRNEAFTLLIWEMPCFSDEFKSYCYNLKTNILTLRKNFPFRNRFPKKIIRGFPLVLHAGLLYAGLACRNICFTN